MDLSEPTLEAVFPTTLVINGTTYTQDHTDSLSSNTQLTFQWGLYTAGSDWIVRICKPDDPASPTEFFYDQFDSADSVGVSAQEWLMTCIIQTSGLWNV